MSYRKPSPKSVKPGADAFAHAIFAKCAYMNTRGEIYSFLNSKFPADFVKQIRYFSGLSSNHVKIFCIPHIKTIIIAFRGTKPTDLSDLLNDTAIVFGAEALSGRFRSAKYQIRKMVTRFKPSHGWKYHVTGHSLGGSLATYATFDKHTRPLIEKTRTYNTGHGLGGIFQALGSTPFNRNMTEYKIKGDVISYVNIKPPYRVRKHKKYKPKRNAHTIDQFTG